MKRTLIVDSDPSGHRAFYLSLIAEALGPERTCLMVPDGHRHLADCFARRGLNLADFKRIPPNSGDAAGLVAQAAAVAAAESCGRVFFAFLDSCIEPLLASRAGFPCPVTGIWFHPYALDRRYRWLPPLDKRLRHRGSVHRALRRPGASPEIERLFFLDPLAAENLRRVNPAIPSTVLPDPWEKPPSLDKAAAREKFDLPRDRIVFLHIGSSEKRKGLADALKAFMRLSSEPETRERVLLLRVGENKRLGRQSADMISSLEAAGMMRTIDGFVPEADFIEYFAAADWILLPYRNFRHSSGILSNALAAGRPVLASGHGLVAATVRESGCGILFRHRSRADLSRKIHEAVEMAAPEIAPDVRAMLAPERFISILRESLTG